MKKTTVERYVAFDGTAFDSEGECLKHERDNFSLRFVGLTREQVDAAFSRADIDLADAFETAGSRISAKRRQSGELRRGRATTDDEGEGSAEAAA